jgi:hypothetical protein
MKLADLTSAQQRQIRSGVARPAKSRLAAAASDRRGPTHLTCHVCSARFTAYAPAERHARDTGHQRLDLEVSRVTL